MLVPAAQQSESVTHTRISTLRFSSHIGHYSILSRVPCAVQVLLCGGFSVAQLHPTLCNPMDCNMPDYLLALLSPWACSDSCPLSQWCHPTISSFVIPFPFALNFSQHQVFPLSQFFSSGGQNIAASASVLPMNIQGRFPLGLTSLISLLSKGLSRMFSSTTVLKCQFFELILISYLFYT